jgi:DNA-binding SARP family transcriptional activator/tetratricopeptide (TPR) repeat protein
MRFLVLGPLEVRVGDRPIPLTSPKRRALLACMLLRPNQVIPVDCLIDDLWGGHAPATARNAIQGHIANLRKLLQGEVGEQPAASRLATSPPGYVLHVEPGELDLHRFEDLLGQARRARVGGDLSAAADGYRAALALWRGPALVNVDSGSLNGSLPAATVQLEELRLTALEERIAVDLALGRHAALIGELRALVTSQPLRERLHGQLITALSRSGRQTEALQAYQDARRMFLEEFGLEPSSVLQALQRDILVGDSAVSATQDIPVAQEVGRPRQLPPDPEDFTGRRGVIEEIRDLLASSQEAAVTICALAGQAGVGKTALAVHVAHRLCERFPDGQLYMDLRGIQTCPMRPVDVVAEFLRALGVHGSAIPEGLQERVKQYRTRLAERRVLVILDNAASEAQVRPLLPGSPTCAALVTSRARLAGLEGARTFTLDVLPSDHAVELLGRIVGQARVAAEPAAARAIVGFCSGLPLAVRIAGAKLLGRPHWRLARLAERLADERQRLDELVVGDLEVRASVQLSYDGLPPAARRLFSRLALVDAPDFAAWTGAALLDVPQRIAEDLVDRLLDAQLLQVAGSPADGQSRYRFHDLLRAYARERAREEEPETARTTALKGALGVWLALAEHADTLLQPGGPQRPSAPIAPPSPLVPAATSQFVAPDPLAWFSVERTALTAAVAQAHALGLWPLVWTLTGTLIAFFEARSHWDDWQRVCVLAVDAARRAGDRHAEGRALCDLGSLALEQSRWNDARTCLDQSMGIFNELGDRRWVAYALRSLGDLNLGQGRLEDAAACYERCLPVFVELGDRRSEASTLRALGIVRRSQGRLDEAKADYLKSLRIFGELGDPRWEAFGLGGLGDVYRDKGQLGDAITCLQQSLAAFSRIGDRRWEAFTLRSLSTVYRHQGRFGDAVACCRRFLEIFKGLGDHRWEVQGLCDLAEVLRGQGRLDEALASLQPCLASARELNEQALEAMVLYSIGHVYQDQNSYPDAVACYEQSLALFRSFGARLWEQKALQRLGETRSAGGQAASAC